MSEKTGTKNGGGNTPNWKNKTVFTGDNLHIMRGLNSETIDLIYLDPPFNSKKTYAAPIGSKAAGAAFKDSWTLSDIDLVEHNRFKSNRPGLAKMLAGSRYSHSKGMFSYLIMMAVRLLEMERLLKLTGSIYLHCDPTASHYLKILMDDIFGAKNFRNEITWKRTASAAKGNQHKPKSWGRNTDILLFYTKTNEHKLSPFRKLTGEEALKKGINIPIYTKP